MTSLAVARRVAITRWQGRHHQASRGKAARLGGAHLHEDGDELAVLVQRRAALPRIEPLLELGLGRGLGLGLGLGLGRGLGGLGLG